MAPKTMLAAQLMQVNDMRCVEAPVPEIAVGQVLVRTEMASICGSDLHIVCAGMLTAELPCPHGYPGHESIGKVVASRSESVAEGAQVLCFPPTNIANGFAQYQALDDHFVVPLPSANVDPSELLMAQQLGTVIFAAGQRPIDVADRSVLVLGQGSAGMFWAYWLKRQGAGQVIVADRCANRLAASAHFGADHVLNPDEVDLADAVRQLTGDGPACVVEAVGRPETLALSIELAAPDADLVWFGLPDTANNVEISFNSFFRKRLSANSTYGAQNQPNAEAFRAALDLIATGQIDVSPLLNRTHPIEAIDLAFAEANDPIASGALKVSVTFSEESEPG